MRKPYPVSLCSAICVLVLLLGGAAFGGAGRAQQPAPPAASSLRVQVDLVQIDVVVTDKNGRPVPGLRKEDFVVSEDGARQEVLAASFEQLGVAPAAPAPAPALGTVPAAQTPGGEVLRMPSAYGRRFIALCFGALGPGDRWRSLEAVSEFLDKRMTEFDYVALIVGDQVVENFTNNRDRLRDTLARMKEGKEMAGLTSRRPAQLAPTEPAEGGGGRGVTAGGLPATVEATLLRFSDNVLGPTGEEQEMFSSILLRDLLAVVRALAELPGKKSLVFFTSGFPVNTANQQTMNRVIESANRAQVSFYTVDARGLIALDAIGDLPHGPGEGLEARMGGTGFREMIATPAIFSPLFGDAQNAALRETQQPLRVLANNTGGRSYTTSNDLGNVFPDVQADTGSYYLIAYRPSNQARDGAFRQFRIEVAGRSDVQVSHRPGYYAPSDTGPAAGTASTGEIPLLVGSEQFRLKGDKYFIPFVYSVPVFSLIPVGATEAHLQLEFQGEAVDLSGQLALEGGPRPAAGAQRSQQPRRSLLGKETVTLDLSASQLAEARQRAARATIDYQTQGIELPPGVYQFNFVVRDLNKKTRGAYLYQLALPPIERKELQLSSLLLTDEVVPLEQVARGDKSPSNPLVYQQQVKVFPKAVKTFSTAFPLYLYFQIYGAGADPAGNPGLRYSAVLIREGRIVYKTPAMAAAQFTDAEAKSVAIPLTFNPGTLKPGQHTVHVEVIDTISNRSTFARERFNVVK